MITPQEFAARRKSLLKQMSKNSIAILPSAPHYMRNSDTEMTFHQDSDFRYITGFEQPESVAVFIPGRTDGEFILFNQAKNPGMELWTGTRPGQEGAITQFGADQSFDIIDFVDMLPELMVGSETVFYAIGRHPEYDQIIIDSIQEIRTKVRGGVVAPVNITNIETILHDMRMTKSPAEIEIMRHAAQVSVKAHINAMKICRPGINEYELEAAIKGTFIQNGCRKEAYSSIIAGGQNACILHYIDNNAPVPENSLILIDAGAEYHGYAADLTRTFPVNGKFSPEQKAVYDIVLAAQQAVMDILKPGITWMDMHATSVKIITEGLVNIGILKGNVDELIETEAYKKFYMHKIGHWIGMEVHDCGTYKVDGKWRELKPGYVTTSEPGIYISPSNTDVDPKWHGIGIRIEDDIAITEDGYDNLSKGLPRTTEEIEAIMAS